MIDPDDINFNNLSVCPYTLEYNEINLEKNYRKSRLRKNDYNSKFYFLVFFSFSLTVLFASMFTDDEQARSAISLVVLLVVLATAIFCHNPKRIYIYYSSPLVLLISILCSKIVSDNLTVKPHIVYMTVFLPLFFAWNYSMNFLLISFMNLVLFVSSIYL